MNRRNFLKMAATAAVASGLAACGATPTVTPVPPTATKPPAPPTAVPAAPTTAPAAPTAVPPTATKAPAAPTAASVAPTATAAPAAAGGTPVRGGTLRLVCESPATSLDPLASKAAPTGDALAYAGLYDQLMFIDPSGQERPELATSYEVSKDNLTYTFKLRQGVKFHDGTTLDANAVKFSVDRLRDPKLAPTAYTSGLNIITDVKVVDAQTVSFVLSAASMSFVQSIIGVKIVSPTAVQKLGADFQLKAVGSGPFKYASWTPGDKVVLDRWDGYWKQGSDGKALPYLDRVEINALPDAAVRQLNMRSGQFDLNTRNDPKDVPTLKSDPNLVVIQTPTGTGYRATINSGKPPFNNKALRQAVQAAIDKESLIKAISFGTGYTSVFGFPKEHWLFNPLGPVAPFDKNLAKQKLVEAGYPNGLDVTISIINRSPDDQMALIVKDNLDAVGIRTTVESLERTTWLDKVNAGLHQFGLNQAGASGADPDSAISVLFPNPSSALTGPGLDKMVALIAQPRSVADRTEPAKYYQQWIALELDEAPYVWFGVVPITATASAKLKGYEIGGLGGWLYTGAWLSK